MLYCVDPTCPYYTELEPEHKNNYPASPVGKRSSVSVTTINNKCFDDDYEDSGSECYDDPRSETEIRKVHRFQELFRGRYSEHEAEVIIEHKNNDIDEAVNFIFEAEPREIRELLNTNDEWKTVEVKRDNVLKDLARRNHIEATFRQFGCSPCDKMWWRKVPSRKEVSRCKRCRVKYDAIPRDREWGWAKFDCHYCGHVFNGFGQVGTTATESPCYNCGAMCTPSEILPPVKQVRRGSRRTHSCSATNCFNRTPGGLHGPRLCVHPMSLKQKVVFPSMRHHSTGSTVATFLSQNELQTFGGYEAPSLPDIDEDGNDGDDDDGAQDGGV